MNVMQNRLLASLPEVSRDRLLDSAETVTLPKNLVLYDCGTWPRYGHFIVSGLAKIVLPTEDGEGIECGLVGYEGIPEGLHLQGPGPVVTRCLIQAPAVALRIRFEKLEQAFQEDTALRAHSGKLAGPVLDMGPYPVNAARYIFGDEPTEVVSAAGSKHSESGLGQDIADTVAVTLRFPGEKLAQFNLSYFDNPTNSFIAIGEKGSVMLDPAYMFGKGLEQTVAIGEKKSKESFKNTDHFGGEMKYFSDCILNDVAPEPNGEEGFADVRVLEGILEALETGKSVMLEPFTRTKRIDTDAQKMILGAVSTPDLVDASNPGKGVEKKPKN